MKGDKGTESHALGHSGVAMTDNEQNSAVLFLASMTTSVSNASFTLIRRKCLMRLTLLADMVLEDVTELYAHLASPYLECNQI